MTAITRRDWMKFSGGVALAALAARGGLALAEGVDPGLRFIDPELRPAAREVLRMSATMNPLSDQTLAPLRALGADFDAPHLPDIRVETRAVPVGKGAPDVPIYIVNAGKGGKRPGILHTHGGGYIAGAAKWEIRYLQELARDLDCIMVSVEYRLAPETPYTGSVEDNYAGLRWMHRHAAELGLDPDRIAVLGESAGGGHAARLAITARDRGEVPLAFQALIYPMLDDRTGSTLQVPSHIGAVGWSAQDNAYGWRAFLGQAPGTPDVPAAGAPARVTDLSGLPPAFIGVGSVDLFVREDVEYAARLMQAGVATDLLVVPGAFHGFDRMAGDSYPAQRFSKAKRNALRRAFGQAVEA